MPYGEIIGSSFRLIWQEKKLWLFGLIGVALSSLGVGIYLALVMGWQSNLMRMITDPVFNAPGDPEEVLAAMFGSLSWFFGALGLLGCFGIIGYVLNLFMRGATIGEAGRAWRKQPTDFGRGVETGLRRSPRMFVIDLIWWLLEFLVVGCGIGFAMAGLFAMIGSAASGNGRGDDVAGIMAALGSIFMVFAAVACLGLLIAVIRGIFAPLMYQSAVQGERTLGSAISEGWRLARRNLGPMIVFLLIVAALKIAVYFIMQLASLPLTGAWMTSYFSMVGGLIESGVPSTPAAANSFLLVLGGLLYAVINLLAVSFVQTLVLTMYARVYQHLTDESAEETPDAAPSLPGQAAIEAA
ncbi:MAG: hypothetical protein J5I90_09460 [Caldilineales bacterium]|nr:hypothetical protein [Caldilineales bacterium]